MYWSNCVCVLFQAKAFTTKVEHVSFPCCYFCKRFTVAEQSWLMFPVSVWIGLSELFSQKGIHVATDQMSVNNTRTDEFI